jgi:hypothetical protein
MQIDSFLLSLPRAGKKSMGPAAHSKAPGNQPFLFSGNSSRRFGVYMKRMAVPATGLPVKEEEKQV